MAFIEPQTIPQTAEIEKYEKLVEISDTNEADWYKRWVFMLSVGNGAAMLALAGSVLEKPDYKFLLFPAWFFLIGLLCAGFAPYAMSRSFRAQASYYHGKRLLVQSKPYSKMTEDDVTMSLGKWTEKSKADRKKFLKAVDILVTISCGCFILGCVIGLIVIGQQQ